MDIFSDWLFIINLMFTVLHTYIAMKSTVIIFLLVAAASGRRCIPFYYATNGAKCGDNTRVQGTYCGIGRCNVFGTNCQGGCRQVSNMTPIEKGDVILCTHLGGWKGALALNSTHVVYPIFQKGFTAAVDEFGAATNSSLGTFCRIETHTFDHYADLLGYTALNFDDYLQRRIEIFSFNWEYQVTFWKYGVAFSPMELITSLGHYME